MFSKLGAATIADSPISLEEYLSFIRSLNMNYVEIRAEKSLASPQDLNSSDIKRINEKLKYFKLTPIIHASFYDINIASLNILPRRASIAQIKECIILAKKLKSNLVVVHAGSVSRDYTSKYAEVGYDNTINSLKEIVSFAEENNITIGLENKQYSKDNYEMVEHFHEHLDLIEIINSPHLKAVIDIGHANLGNMDICEYIYILKDYIVEVHLHDNMGEIDEHLPLGEGNTKIREALEEIDRLGIRVPLILELKSMEDIKKSVEFLKSQDYFIRLEN